MTKAKQDNNMIDRIGVVYAKNDIELSGPLRLGAFKDENKTGQQHDRSYGESTSKVILKYGDQS